MTARPTAEVTEDWAGRGRTTNAAIVDPAVSQKIGLN